MDKETVVHLYNVIPLRNKKRTTFKNIVEPQSNMLSERSQSQNVTCCTITFI